MWLDYQDYLSKKKFKYYKGIYEDWVIHFCWVCCVSLLCPTRIQVYINLKVLLLLHPDKTIMRQITAKKVGFLFRKVHLNIYFDNITPFDIIRQNSTKDLKLSL
jgi:hypothetical protein